jgi:hypothetical protein
MRFDSDEALENFLMSNNRGRIILRNTINKEMPYFLCTSQGQEWIERIEKESSRPKVLLVIYGDGYSEVYSSGSIRFEVVKVPTLPMKRMPVDQIEPMEKAAKATLNKVWVDLWENGKVREVLDVTPMSPVQFAKREIGRVAFNLLKRIERALTSTTLDSGGARSAGRKSTSSSTEVKNSTESGTHAV